MKKYYPNAYPHEIKFSLRKWTVQMEFSNRSQTNLVVTMHMWSFWDFMNLLWGKFRSGRDLMVKDLVNLEDVMGGK